MFDRQLATLSNIDDFIYIGSIETAHKTKLLQKHGITHILNVSEEKSQIDPSFVYSHIPFMDGRTVDISLYFEEAFKFIESAKNKSGKILIHCQYGMSRSVSIAIAWLLKNEKQKTSYEDVLKLVVSKRPMASPNEGFTKKLKEFANKIHQTTDKSESKEPNSNIITKPVTNIHEFKLPNPARESLGVTVTNSMNKRIG